MPQSRIVLKREDLEHLLLGGELQGDDVCIISKEMDVQEISEMAESAICEIRHGDTRLRQVRKLEN